MTAPVSFRIDVEGTNLYIMPETKKDKCVGCVPHCLIYKQDGKLYNTFYLTYMDFMRPPFELSLFETRIVQRYVKENRTRLLDAFNQNKLTGEWFSQHKRALVFEMHPV